MILYEEEEMFLSSYPKYSYSVAFEEWTCPECAMICKDDSRLKNKLGSCEDCYDK